MAALEHRPAHRRRILMPTVAVAALLGLGSCSTSGSSDAASTTTTTVPRSTTTATSAPERTTTTEGSDDPIGTGLEWCPSVAAVAKILGGEATAIRSVGSTFSDGASYTADGCSYDREDEKGSVDVQRLTAEDIDPADLFGTIETAAAKDSDEHGFVHLPDLGDDAYRDGQSLAVRNRGQILLLSYTPTGGFDDEDPDKALRVATAVLPLKLSEDDLDCDAVADALVDEFGAVDHTLSGGGVDGVDNVNLETKNCTVVFKDKGEATVAVAPDDQWKAWVAAKKDSGFRADFTELSIGELAAFDDGESLFVDDGDEPLRVRTEDIDDEAKAAKVRLAVARLTLGS